MIFHDQETAKMFRERARTDLTAFIDEIAQSVRVAMEGQEKPGDVDGENVRYYVESQISMLPLTVSLLLNKSGYVGIADETGFANCVVYFDNAENNNIVDATADAPGSLIGGITPDGAIHT